MELGQRRSLQRMCSQGVGVQDGIIAFFFQITGSRRSELVQILVYEVLELVHVGLVPKEVYKVCQLVLSAGLLKFLLQLLFVNKGEEMVLGQNAGGHALLADQLLVRH